MRLESRNFNVLSQCCLGFAVLLASTLCGCAGAFTQSKSIPVQSNATESAGTYTVEMSGGFGKSSVYEGTIDGPITVQTALERSGAIKKYHGMEITVLRVVEETGRGLKMPIRYSVGDKAVPPEQDYSIFPNDRIVIEASSNNLIDKIVDSVGG